MTNYTNYHAISREIARIRPGDPESTLYGVWNAILGLQFPIAQGYITRPQDRHTAQSGQYGFSDLHTFQYRGNAANASKFLIVQCKRAGSESQDSVWRDAVDQLDQYLCDTHGRRRPADRTPVYGIAAVGLKMRVYRYDDVNQCVLNWAPRGLPQGAQWDLESEAGKVQRILDHILNNH
ncbi:hypothetical protein N7474_000352 [Penicillium riverlandense]|uniref:uncharacterized protein n=1 Tax=Penicillium riverlandense TaxID=1903569 RepID=UPI002546B26E|nr:uncharacterized protein N7474_000352 [Penicillium riverlandense]KAJ5832041.1 hypothetical protein N7474_000352 [Penicillium riverlandense]